MKLILAEKPSLGKNIAEALNVREKKDGYLKNNQYYISWAFGHLLRLKNVDEYLGEKTSWKDVKLPFFPDFEFVVKEDRGIKKQIKIIETLLNREEVNEIILAGDADREGQLIIDLILAELKNKKKEKRLWLPEQTEETIKKQIQICKDNSEYKNLHNEGKARTYMDWLYGINLTRFITLKAGQLLPCGRVLIPIVKFIYDREMEIRNFSPENYYILESKTEFNGETIILSLRNEKFKEEEKAKEEAERINAYRAIVQETEEKEVEKMPKRLFSLSKLQAELSKTEKISFAESLPIIQTLYEKKLITYPRTNTEYLAEEEKERVQKIIDKINREQGKENLEIKNTKRIFDSSKIESHSAIIPTTKSPGERLEEKEQIVYQKVLNRFISNFLTEKCIIRQKNLKIAVGDKIFNLTGESVHQKGFLAIEPVNIENKLPDLKKGDEFPIYFKPTLKTTVAPKKVSEEELANYLKNPFRKEISETEDEEEYKNILKGIEIGTEATRTAIVENAKKYGYIEQKKQSFGLLPKGEYFIETLKKLKINLFKEKSVATSKLQKDVLHGKKTIKEAIEETKKEIQEILNYQIEIEKKKNFEREVIGVCPRCGNEIFEGEKAFFCSGWKDGCKFALWKEDKFFTTKGKKITKSMAKQLLKTKKISVKGLKSEKKNKTYDAIVHLKDTGEWVNFEMEFQKKRGKRNG